MSEVLSLAQDRDAAIRRAVEAVRAGSVVVTPTDTVYGIAADPFSRAATSAIFEIKRRPRALPLPILVSRPRQAWALCSEVPPEAAELVAAFWPGALTVILPEAEGLEWDLGATHGTIAVRMPDHTDLLALLERTGPLAATSANVSGEPTPPTCEAVRARLGDAVAVYLDGGPGGDVPSTIVDLSGPRPAAVREGAIPLDAVERALGTALARD